MPKHGREGFETRQQVEDRTFCYYCGKEAPDRRALQDHQKVKHLQCTHCRKKLDSIGGLKVHIESVHKLKLEKVENALPERESPDGPEIYLDEGIPAEMKEAYEAKKWRDYEKTCFEYYRRTGNPYPGSDEALKPPTKKIRLGEAETPEEKKARKAAWVAKKMAEKAAREAREASGGAAIKNEPTDDLASQQSYVPLGQMDANIKSEPYINSEPSEAYPSYPQPQTQYYPGYSTSPPMAGLPVTMPPQQGYGPGMGPQYGHSPTNYGQPPFQPPFPSPSYPPQPVGFGYGGSPQGLPPQPFAGGAPPTQQSNVKREPRNSMDSKPSIPAAPPGLPPKPSFNAPSYSKEAMDKFHAGHQVSQLKPYARPHSDKHSTTVDFAANDVGVTSGNTADPDQASGGLEGPSTAKINRQLDDLLSGGQQDVNGAATEADVTHAIMNDAATIDVPAEPMLAPAKTSKGDTETIDVPAEPMLAPTKTSKGDASRITKQKLSDDGISWEEKKGKQPKYVQLTSEKRRQKRRNNTVVEPADSQAVTGNVADDLEQ